MFQRNKIVYFTIGIFLFIFSSLEANETPFNGTFIFKGIISTHEKNSNDYSKDMIIAYLELLTQFQEKTDKIIESDLECTAFRLNPCLEPNKMNFCPEKNQYSSFDILNTTIESLQIDFKQYQKNAQAASNRIQGIRNGDIITVSNFNLTLPNIPLKFFNSNLITTININLNITSTLDSDHRSITKVDMKVNAIDLITITPEPGSEFPANVKDKLMRLFNTKQIIAKFNAFKAN